MAPTIFIKFCGFIVHLNPNKKIVLIICPSPNVAPKPTDQSHSHSISRVPLQISLALSFVFYLPSKFSVVHIRKKFKIFIFSKRAPTIFIKFCRFIVHSNVNNMTLSAFPGKILVTRIIFINFLSVA